MKKKVNIDFEMQLTLQISNTCTTNLHYMRDLLRRFVVCVTQDMNSSYIELSTIQYVHNLFIPLDAFLWIYYFWKHYSFEAGICSTLRYLTWPSDSSDHHFCVYTRPSTLMNNETHFWDCVCIGLISVSPHYHAPPTQLLSEQLFLRQGISETSQLWFTSDLHFCYDSIIMSPVFCWRMSPHRETTTLSLQMGSLALEQHAETCCPCWPRIKLLCADASVCLSCLFPL